MFKHVVGEQTRASELGEERRLVLHLASSAMPDAEETLLASARVTWAKTFGAPRAQGAGTLRALTRKLTVPMARQACHGCEKVVNKSRG